jgi:hypothetical protein
MGQPFADWPPDDKILSLFRDWIVAQNDAVRFVPELGPLAAAVVGSGGKAAA